jgi:hypothetical protein
VRIPEQVKRLAIVIGSLVVAALIVRFYIIPPKFTDRDQHRASTVEREIAKPVKFAGSRACQDCHEDITVKKAKGFHKTLSCEGCHGPAVRHAEDPSAAKPSAPRDRKFCPVCHAYDPSRPTGFPQINPTAHNPIKPCITCHNPHDPVPQRVPQACAACHGQIERTKALSSHALLQCTTCHKTSEQHRRAPRTAIPSKPETREFCGTCHGKTATQPDAPKIDLATHNPAYLCWQCHYPHLPEGQG